MPHQFDDASTELCWNVSSATTAIAGDGPEKSSSIALVAFNLQCRKLRDLKVVVHVFAFIGLAFRRVSTKFSNAAAAEIVTSMNSRTVVPSTGTGSPTLRLAKSP